MMFEIIDTNGSNKLEKDEIKEFFKNMADQQDVGKLDDKDFERNWKALDLN